MLSTSLSTMRKSNTWRNRTSPSRSSVTNESSTSHIRTRRWTCHLDVKRTVAVLAHNAFNLQLACVFPSKRTDSLLYSLECQMSHDKLQDGSCTSSFELCCHILVVRELPRPRPTPEAVPKVLLDSFIQYLIEIGEAVRVDPNSQQTCMYIPFGRPGVTADTPSSV